MNPSAMFDGIIKALRRIWPVSPQTSLGGKVADSL